MQYRCIPTLRNRSSLRFVALLYCQKKKDFRPPSGDPNFSHAVFRKETYFLDGLKSNPREIGPCSTNFHSSADQCREKRISQSNRLTDWQIVLHTIKRYNSNSYFLLESEAKRQYA